MAKRPAGLTAFIGAFDKAHIDFTRLRKFERPVYFALGGLSNPDYYGRMAERLRHVFPDFTLETYPDRHHFESASSGRADEGCRGPASALAPGRASSRVDSARTRRGLATAASNPPLVRRLAC